MSVELLVVNLPPPRKNSNIAMLFTLLHKICAVMQEYFKEVSEQHCTALHCSELLHPKHIV